MAERRFTDATAFTTTLKSEIGEQFVPAAASEIKRYVLLRALQRVDSGSPVGLDPRKKGYAGGHFRRNNQVTTGAPAHTELPGEDSSGGGAVSEGTRRINALVPFSLDYISNVLRYAPVIEFGQYPASSRGKGQITADGFSRQAPRGVYFIAFQEMKLDVKKAIARIAARGIKTAPGVPGAIPGGAAGG